jgi:hypothetical protein
MNLDEIEARWPKGRLANSDARADVVALIDRVRELEEENARLSGNAHMWKQTSLALRGYHPDGWMVDELHKLSKERDELHRLAYSWAKAGGKP